MADIVQRVACKAVIANESGQVLVLREAATYQEGTNLGAYGVPGGRINPGEPFLEGLRREVREESGLEVVVGEPFMAGEWFPVIRGVKNHIVAIFFACQPKSGTITLSDEHDDYQWVNQREAKQLNIMDDEAKALDKFFALTPDK